MGPRHCVIPVLMCAACAADEAAELPAALPDAGQSEDVAEPVEDAVVDPAPDASPPEVLLRDLTLGEPRLWARPTVDYLEAGRGQVMPGQTFLTQIHDLRVYDGRLYLGYGDANINLGRVTPIEFRYLPSPTSGLVEAEFASDEEQLDRYRVLDGTLFMAGIDATEDAWLGNIYFKRSGEGWIKSRTLSGGVHVHDVASFQGAIFAVGSGATPEEWMAGDIYAHLWRSEDGGERFEIIAREHNGGQGDSRWTRLVVFEGDLYLFGYKTDPRGTINALSQFRFDGESVTALPDDHPLRLAFVTETYPMPEGAVIVRGLDASADPVIQRAWMAQPGGRFESPPVTEGKSLVDVFHHAATGETLFMLANGVSPGGLMPGILSETCISVTSDGVGFDEVTCVDTRDPPVSLAWWGGYLFLGTQSGKILRADPQ